MRAEEEEARRRDEKGARQDFVISSWTSGKNGEARWRGAWWRPGKIHSSRWLWDGSSGGDHSKPSSFTMLDRTRKWSVFMPGQDALNNPASSRERSGSTAMARSMAKGSSLEERRFCSRRRNLRSLGKCPHYIARFPADSGGLSSHRLCSSAAAIGVIAVTTQTNGRAVPALFIKKKASVLEKREFPLASLIKTQY